MSKNEQMLNAPAFILTAYYNLNNGCIKIIPEPDDSAPEEAENIHSLGKLIDWLKIDKSEQTQISEYLSAGNLRRELADKENFSVRYHSAPEKNSFEWYEINISVCERNSGTPCSVLLRIKNMNLILQDKDIIIQNHMQRILADCLKGFGAVFQNIILIDVNANIYLAQNPYGSDAANPVIQPNGTYSDDNYAYGMSFIHPDDRELFRSYTTIDAYRERLTENGSHNDFKVRHIMNGDYRWVRVYTIRLGGDDKTFRVLYFVNDIEEQTEKEEKSRQLIEDALSQAHSAERTQSEFISNMSHDIRTPLNAIAGLTMLARKNIEQKEMLYDYLSKIDVSCKLLSEIINGVLDLSQLKSGKTILDIKPFRLDDLTGELDMLMRPQALKKQIDLEIDISGIHHRYIKGDYIQLFKILQNIVSNAVKYTNRGGKVNLTIEEHGSMLQGNRVYHFICADNGIGMSGEFLKNAFTPFERENDELVSRTQGTGLGLTIIKNLVEVMGGELRLESEKGKGTVFTVIIGFPYLDEDEEAYASERGKSTVLPDDVSLNGYRVLLAEDNEINRDISIAILRSYGAAVDTAINGREAVEKFLDGGSGRYDFILMDIRMPDMDGYKATEEIRRQPGEYAADIPIIAMTAEAFSEEVRKAYSCGMNAYISKPIIIEKLIKTLLSFL